MGNSDKSQKDKPVILEQIRAFFAALQHGVSFPSQQGGMGHFGGSVLSPNAKAKRLKRNKAAKMARRLHRRG